MLELFASTRTRELNLLSPEQATAFCEFQCEAQRRSYSQRGGAECHVIESDATAIGRLWLSREADYTTVLDITVLPAQRGAGVGTQVLERLLAEGTPVRLAVMRDNPAQRLYQRLGFRVIGEDDVRLHLEWTQPNTAS